MECEVLTYIYIYFIMTPHASHEHIGTRYIPLRVQHNHIFFKSAITEVYSKV